MEWEVVKREEMSLSDRLAVVRTVLAADRTLLAWVRTSVSLIGFGFAIYEVLDHVQKAGVARFVGAQTPRHIGIFMILVGIVPLALSMLQHWRTVKRLGGTSPIFLNPNMVAAGAIFLLGLALLVVVVMNISVF